MSKSSLIALVTGISGQDGAYRAELLLEKGCTVYGTYRRTSSVNFWRMEELGVQNHPNFHLVEFDLTDPGCIINWLQKVQPDKEKFYDDDIYAFSQGIDLIRRYSIRNAPTQLSQANKA